MSQFKNPFDPANFTSGGGLWDGKVVTITGSKGVLSPMKNGDGSPVLGDDGNPVIKHVWQVTGIAEDADAERREEWSAGSLLPTPDGEGFTSPKDGSIVPFDKRSEAGKAMQALVDGGFDPALLFDGETGKPKLSGLVGCKILFRAEDKLDRNGHVKKNKKGYTQQRFYPSKLVGFAEGKAPVDAAAHSALEDKAVGVIVGILKENNGKVSRAALVRLLSAKLAGDTDANKIIGLVTKESFHTDRPWTRDDTSYNLTA